MLSLTEESALSNHFSKAMLFPFFVAVIVAVSVLARTLGRLLKHVF